MVGLWVASTVQRRTRVWGVALGFGSKDVSLAIVFVEESKCGLGGVLEVS
jgi:hypothetical protein